MDYSDKNNSHGGQSGAVRSVRDRHADAGPDRPRSAALRVCRVPLSLAPGRGGAATDGRGQPPDDRDRDRAFEERGPAEPAHADASAAGPRRESVAYRRAGLRGAAAVDQTLVRV